MQLTPLLPIQVTSVPLKNQDVHTVDTVQKSTDIPRSSSSVEILNKAAPTDESDTYTRPRLVPKTFTNIFSASDSAAVQNMSKGLNDTMAQSAAGGHLKVSGLMSQLSGLAGETASFEAEVRLSQLSEEAAASGVSPDFNEQLRGNKGGSMTVQIRTKDGDVIDVELGTVTNAKGEKSLTFMMTVDGELSEKEMKAIDEVAQSLGKVADRYFSDGEAALNELRGLDNDLLGGFSLKLQKGDESLQLNYNVSKLDGSMQLDGKFNGYSFDVRREAGHSLVDDTLLDNPQYQQYLQLIEESGQEYGTDNETVRFMKDGLGALFGLSVSAEEQHVKQVDTETKALSDFHSNLPDFEASFDSPVFVNKYHPADKSFMSLTMSQESSLEKTDSGEISLTQNFKYQQSIHTFESLPGHAGPDLKHGDYIIQRQEKDEQVVRELELNNSRPVVATEYRMGDESLVRETKERFLVTDVQKEEDSYANVINLLEQIDASGKAVSESQQEQLLNSDVLELFEYAGETDEDVK